MTYEPSMPGLGVGSYEKPEPRKFNFISPKQGEYNTASDGTAYVRFKGGLRKLTPEQLRDIQLREAQGQNSALPTT